MPCCYVYMPLLYGFERSVRWIVTALEYCKARRENMAWSRCARRHLTWQHLESGGGLWWCLAAWSRGCKHADILSSWSRSWLGVDMHIRSYIRCPCAVFFPHSYLSCHVPMAVGTQLVWEVSLQFIFQMNPGHVSLWGGLTVDLICWSNGSLAPWLMLPSHLQGFWLVVIYDKLNILSCLVCQSLFS